MKKLFLPLVLILFAGRLLAQDTPQPKPKSPVSVTLKTDTVVYSIDHKTTTYNKVDQLLGAISSFEITADGTVKHLGNSVEKFKLNGKNFAGLDMIKVLRRLPVSVVENMEIIDDYGDTPNTRKHPDPYKVLNVNIRPEVIADLEYYLANRPSRPILPLGRYDDPAIYGDYNYINEHNPLDRQTNRAVRNMLAISDGMHEVDQYGDQIPHFLIQTPYPVKDVMLKKDNKRGAAKAIRLNP